MNTKDIAARIASDMLGLVFREARGEVGKQMLVIAKKWGATIPEASEAQFLNEIGETFAPPAQWPSVEVSAPTVVAGMTNAAVADVAVSKKVGRKKQASDSAPSTTKKAGDFAALVVPAGVAIPRCPTIMKSGDNKDKPCGKECKRVLDDHDPSDPVCARLECDHCYCGAHVAKAYASSAGGNSRTRLEASADPDAKPVIFTTSGGETKINAAAVGATEPTVSESAKKSAIARLQERMREKAAGNKPAAPSPSEEM